MVLCKLKCLISIYFFHIYCLVEIFDLFLFVFCVNIWMRLCSLEFCKQYSYLQHDHIGTGEEKTTREGRENGWTGSGSLCQCNLIPLNLLCSYCHILMQFAGVFFAVIIGWLIISTVFLVDPVFCYFTLDS